MAKATDDTHNPLRMCFENSEPKQAQIARAVKILLELLDKPENPTMMKRWAQLLTPFSGDQLAEAFNTVALTSTGWPTLGDITAPILEAEYAEDLAWLLQGLRLHKKGWRDREAIYGPAYRKPGAHMDDWTAGPLLEAVIPAPAIPPRLVAALRVLGASGVIADGLAELARHPASGGYPVDAAEVGKVKFQVERDFKAAWMMARRKELAS